VQIISECLSVQAQGLSSRHTQTTFTEENFVMQEIPCALLEVSGK